MSKGLAENFWKPAPVRHAKTPAYFCCNRVATETCTLVYYVRRIFAQINGTKYIHVSFSLLCMYIV